MKIVIMADSLAMPRSGETNVAFEATYPYLLEQSLRKHPETHDAMIIERGMRRRTIEYVLDEWSELVELKTPDVAVIHVGIVDCAPRVFLRRERQFIERIRPIKLRDSILNFVHKRRPEIVKFRKKVYVPAERFQTLITEVIRRARASSLKSLVFVNIITPPVDMEMRSPGFIANVDVYNDILKTSTNGPGIQLIDLNRLIKENGGVEKLTVDGIHINNEGHALLAKELENHVISLSNQE
jgi:lysophospholipase L1-like esterase